MKKLIFATTDYSNLNTNIGLLIFRLFIGLTMAFAHGLGKIPPSEGFMGYVASLGMPGILAWGAALSEFLGGIFVALGLGTRLSSLSIAFTMFIAAFMAHAQDPWSKKEFALLYMFSAIMLAFVGPGRFSVDRFIKK